jgi:dipeptidase E
MKLLTSTGLSSKDIFNIMPILQQQKGWKTVCIIVSADSKENKYMQLAKKQFEELNFSKIDFIDFFTQDINTIEQYNLIYIAGGNTFKLLNSITLHNKGLENLKDILIKKDVIGVSAGSIILTPTIRIASEIDPDKFIDINSFKSLNIVPFEIYPHYEERFEEEINNYEQKYHTHVMRITDTGYLLLDGEF